MWLSMLSLADYKQNGIRTFYTDVEKPLKVSQTLACLEVRTIIIVNLIILYNPIDHELC